MRSHGDIRPSKLTRIEMPTSIYSTFNKLAYTKIIYLSIYIYISQLLKGEPLSDLVSQVCFGRSCWTLDKETQSPT